MNTDAGQFAGRRRPEGGVGAAAAGVDAFSKMRTIVAPCPPGKGMLGAGFRTQPDGPDPNLVVDNVLDDFTPNGGSTTAPTSVRVTHYEEDSNVTAWIATAHAICAYESGY
jgi:hypothetical protein